MALCTSIAWLQCTEWIIENQGRQTIRNRTSTLYRKNTPFQLAIDKPGVLSTIYFGEDAIFTQPLAADEVEIKVKICQQSVRPNSPLKMLWSILACVASPWPPHRTTDGTALPLRLSRANLKIFTTPLLLQRQWVVTNKCKTTVFLHPFFEPQEFCASAWRHLKRSIIW